MAELSDFIRAVVQAFREQNSPPPAGAPQRPSPSRRPGAQSSPARTLRDLLAERAAPPGQAQAPPAAGRQVQPGGTPQLRPRAPSAVPQNLATGPAPFGDAPVSGARYGGDAAPPGAALPGRPLPAVSPATARSLDDPARSAAREAGLVRGLFADPQTLVAAFIAAEVLAPPVALRSAGTGWRGTAL